MAAPVWRPQPGPQKALIDCTVGEILFGGARGGGKTDGVLGKWGLKEQRYGSHFNAVFFRKEMPQQDDLIERAREIYAPLGASWLDQKKTFEMPNGGRVRFRPLESIQDAEKYQGQNLSDAAVEEAGNYANPAPIDMLHGALRSAAGVPVQLILTANPGGAGHQWLKHRYVDPAPMGMRILTRSLPNGDSHRYVYIPSRVENNRILLAKDPGYVSRLYLVGSKELVAAWVAGDWNVVTGAYFDEWRTERHVIAPFAIPAHWTRFRSFDWGSAKPFSLGWWAVCSDDTAHDGRTIPRGALVRYREYYGASGPDVGLKLHSGVVATRILERQPQDERIDYSVADPAIFREDGGPCIAEEMARATKNALIFRPADNSRVAGWQQLRKRLDGDDDGRPMLYVFSTCTDSIRTIPALMHDDHKPEDVDTDSEDHAADEWRYACMSRPWQGRKPVAPSNDVTYTLPTMAELTKRHVDQWQNRQTGRI